ncbi:hypothetical protein BO71DRAFT_432262 [Aspergillus ellipticus CBS 707.79]|uniref:Uncharacterized protein n=1 Tax=Aspergillus ellipticus CBS 707.79 TaxID=1448320 RepID=A0A319DVD9_9EURO|nr:hypothetical protein BO71DRAFT_432262 [Aspergillus ellipticus CBS 707.79]
MNQHGQASIARLITVAFHNHYAFTSIGSFWASVIVRKMIYGYPLQQRTAFGYRPAALVSTSFSWRGHSLTRAVLYFREFLDWTSDAQASVRDAIERIAKDLIWNFLLPVRMASAFPWLGVCEEMSATEARLRQMCLVRDQHRCVVCRRFDSDEAARRYARDGAWYSDDEGKFLAWEPLDHFGTLSLGASPGGRSQSSDLKTNVLDILYLLRLHVHHLIESPANALSLHFHLIFLPTQQPDTYGVHCPDEAPPLVDGGPFPFACTLPASHDQAVPPLSPFLLRYHAMVAQLLGISDAWGHVDRLAAGFEWARTAEEGTANLDYLLTLRLEGWVDSLRVLPREMRTPYPTPCG